MRTTLTTGVSLFLLTQAAHASWQPRLINGKPVDPGTAKEIVSINTDGAGCTATIVGPRVILTAAHCGDTGAVAKFTLNGKKYRARLTQSPLYLTEDHDLSLGVTTEEMNDISYASIGGQAMEGVTITLFGYGCTEVGGGTPDGILRYGNSVITHFSRYDMVSTMPGGAALCFGDSGGPAFVSDNGKRRLLGVNSKGNIIDTNYNSRTDLSESKRFFEDFIKDNGVNICGINTDCP